MGASIGHRIFWPKLRDNLVHDMSTGDHHLDLVGKPHDLSEYQHPTFPLGRNRDAKHARVIRTYVGEASVWNRAGGLNLYRIGMRVQVLHQLCQTVTFQGLPSGDYHQGALGSMGHNPTAQDIAAHHGPGSTLALHRGVLAENLMWLHLVVRIARPRVLGVTEQAVHRASLEAYKHRRPTGIPSLALNAVKDLTYRNARHHTPPFLDARRRCSPTDSLTS